MLSPTIWRFLSIGKKYITTKICSYSNSFTLFGNFKIVKIMLTWVCSKTPYTHYTDSYEVIIDELSKRMYSCKFCPEILAVNNTFAKSCTVVCQQNISIHLCFLFSCTQNMPKLFHPISGLISMPRKSMHYIMVNVNKGFSTWTACPLHTNKTTK